MTRHMNSYSYYLFFSMVIMGIFISISSSNWLTAWMGMELNIYSIIPMMMASNTFKEKEAAMKYLFSQAVPSNMILFLTLTMASSNSMSSIIIFMALSMKLGMAPAHFWLPSVMGALPWNMCWLLSTVQKITPFFLIFQSISSAPSLFMMSATASAIIGGLGGMNQTQLRPLMAYSSIGHMAWVTASAMYSVNLSSMYLTAYILIISATMYMFYTLNISSTNSMSFHNTSPYMPWLTLLTLMSLSGLPPSFGFFPKLMVLMTLAKEMNITLTLVLIMGTLMNIYYYFKISLSMISNSPNTKFMKMAWNKTITLPWAMSSISSFMTAIVSIMMFSS